MAAALAPKARAGWSISVSLGTPVVYAPPPVVVAPAPAPVYGPTRVVVAPAPVYVPAWRAPVCQPVKFVPAGHLKTYDRWDDHRGWARRGHGRGGWGKHGRH